MVKLKICGNHHAQDIQAVAPFAGEIDYLGFIFTTHSKRYVPPERVRGWLEQDPRLLPKAVAVFLDQPLTEVCQVLEMTGIGQVQLHGTEQAAYCQQLRQRLPHLLIWKVIPVPNQGNESITGERLVQLERQINTYLDLVDVVLLDTKVQGQAGGTGQTFDWRLVPHVALQVQRWNETGGRQVKLFVAGGLTADNIGLLLAMDSIDGIDLASGAETEGRKDMRKIEAVINEVKQYAKNR
ncbi:phosphoribosylanthranilate isomerase [Caldalkalibacillus uzonensis]|uniref:N-(5'-phosphoribosyl)anthranilate isomerase n=1 Tax=Caldalkalibacillus uzonensis TaxID=353224 RepID=A0ABU0CMK0_9BACI|nr:hypothetical protein [Caldalkalibacillus uzonensis]MDQ0337648.1 phosphoribosylanthranilate isomerase [Caldalkalibacillus uzonensis]